MSQKIIDFHCHVFPESVALKATENVGKYYSIKMNGTGMAKDLVRKAVGLNMQGFVIHSSATKPEQVPHINDFIAGYMRKEKLLIGFGTIHKEYEKTEEEIKRIKNLGLKGIKLHPDFQNFLIDDPLMYPIYQLASDLHMPVLMHLGDKTFDNSSPQRMSRILDLFPKLKVIGAHMGGYGAWDTALDHLYGKNMYFDTSSTMIEISCERTRELILAHGVDKILFGSDFPVQWTKEAVEDIYNLKLDDSAVEKILYSNAAKLLGEC